MSQTTVVGILGQNSSREVQGPGPREFLYTDKQQQKPRGGGLNP